MILCDALNSGGECFCVLCFRSLSYFCWVWLFVAFLWVNLFSLRELVLIMKYHGWSGNWIFFRYNGAWALICFMLIVMNDAFMSYTHPLVVQRVYVRTPIVHSAAIVMPLLQHTAWIYVFFFLEVPNEYEFVLQYKLAHLSLTMCFSSENITLGCYFFIFLK